MKILTIFVLNVLLTGAACQRNATNTPNKNAKPPPPVAANNSVPNISVNNASPPEPQARLFNGKGVVTQIELEAGWVELNHEEIKGLMPAMIMQFNFSDREVLKKLKVGDKVSFVLEDKGGAERLVSIKKN